VQKLYATAKLVEGSRIIIDNNRAYGVVVGTDLEPTALELCVMSYAGCFTSVFSKMAKKMRVALKDLELTLEAVRSDAAGTITEANFNITANAPENRIEKLLNLTLDNCPVGKLFKQAGVKINVNIQTEK
jgi:uncharacterized OsmC-like protein